MTSGALGSEKDGLMSDEDALDLMFSPCAGAGGASALAMIGDGGVAGLSIGSTTCDAGFEVGREGIEEGCEGADLEGPAGGCGRSTCRLVVW